jgi:transposase
MTNSPKPKSWRDVLPIHPAAELFPRMSEDELRELARDINKNGLRYPIILWREKEGAKAYLLDGRNRLDALESIGIQTVDERGMHRHWSFRDGDPYDLVLSFNVHRRHLTGEQKRELIAKVLKERPGLSDRRIAAVTGRSKTTVAAQRKKLEAGGQIDHLKKRTGADGKEQAAQKKSLPQITAQHDGHYEQANRPKCLEAKTDSAVAEEASGLVEQTDSAGNREVHHDSLTGRLDHPVTASAEVSVEQRRAEMAQLATAPPDDLVDQAIRLVEQMTADQRREFIARLSDTLKVIIATEIGSTPADLSIPDFLKCESANRRVPT